MQKGHERGEVGGEGKKERCAIFCIKSCWWQPPCQAPCEYSGVNSGLEARLVSVCGVCGGFRWVGVRWGQEVALSPNSRLKGDEPADVYVCMWECVCCVVQSVHVACV